MRLRRDAPSGTSPDVLWQSLDASTSNFGYPSCCSIAIDDYSIYWNDNTSVFRVPINGSDRRDILYQDPSTRMVRDVRVDSAGTVYFIEILGDGSTRLTFIAVPVSLEAYTVNGATAYALGNGRLYYAYQSGGTLTVSSRALDFSDRTTHYTGTGSVNAMAVDANNLYLYGSTDSSGVNRILRLSHSTAGATPEPISAPLGTSSIVNAGQYLYWVGTDGIYRLLVSAMASLPLGDVWVTNMEITQVIQSINVMTPTAAQDNVIPLFAFKPTVLRVYLQSINDSAGAWTNIQGSISASGILRAASPVNRSATALTTGSVRHEMDNSLTFLLTPEATAEGTRDFTVQLFTDGRAESDTSNNTFTITATFRPEVSIDLYGYLVDIPTPSGMNVAPTWVDFGRHSNYARALYPVTNMNITRLGSGSYPAPSDADTDIQSAQSAAHRAVLRIATMQSPSGNYKIYTLTPRGFLGAGGWCCNTSGGHQAAWGANTTAPNDILGHEVGHQWWGNDHVVSPEHSAAYPITDYPFGHSSIGNDVGVSISSNTTAPVTLRPGLTVMPHWHDIMSYGGMSHISRYSYCRLMPLMTSVSCPSGADRVHEGMNTIRTFHGGTLSRLRQDATTVLYVSGAIYEDGSAAFDPFETFSYEGDLPQSQGETYRVVLEDANFNPLAEYAFNISNHYHESMSEMYPAVFGAALPYSPETARIALYSANGGVLAERYVSPSTPEVRLLPLDFSFDVKGVQQVYWEAGDPDGDALTYTLSYSADGGKTWTPIQVLLTEPTASVNFDQLPGSSEALLQVSASDGVNTAFAQTDLFTVERKAPEILLALPENGMMVASVNSAILLEAAGYDAEDGSILNPDNYHWTSNIDGDLGAGSWIVPTLQTGEHVITLTVFDSDGNVSALEFLLVVSD